MSHLDSRFVHPLMQMPIGATQNPEEWLERWTHEAAKDTPNADELVGLLFRVPSFHSREELIPLCLDIADGYRMSGYQFRLPDEGDHPVDYGKLRLSVAQKAFWALCEGFFKDKKGDKYSHSPYPFWATFVVQKRIFKKILWFIFDNERRSGVDINLPHRPGKDGSLAHQEQVFHRFVIDLVVFAWKFDGLRHTSSPVSDEVASKMFQEARPDLIRVLHQIGELDLLKQLARLDSEYPVYSGLSGRERRALRNLAIGHDTTDTTGEKMWQAIEAQVGRGNAAAEFLWCYLPRLKAVRRERTAKRREEQRHREEHRQRELERLEVERTEAEERLTSALQEK